MCHVFFTLKMLSQCLCDDDNAREEDTLLQKT